MFYLEGPEEALKTIIVLASRDERARDLGDLRRKYIDFTVSVGGECMRPADANMVCYDEGRIKPLISKYLAYSILTDIPADVIDTPHEARAEAMEEVMRGKLLLAEDNPELHAYFDLVIHTLFYQRSEESGGGSVSSAPGVIWCAPRRTWSQEDIAEFLVHELAHNALFLDERRYQHYLDFESISNPDYFAVSSILGKPRPLDKAFHSLVVAHEVLAHRRKTGEPRNPVVHPPSEKLFVAAQKTVASIRGLLEKHPHIVTARFRDLLDTVELSILSIHRPRAEAA